MSLAATASCDVLIVGGGPAGSTCARELARSGFDVVIADKAAFPRDKTCAGWVTPAVVDELGIDLEEYGSGRTLQPLHGFLVARMGDAAHVHRYDTPVSYGIRRCEFDHYLLTRSGARVLAGCRIDRIERGADGWWRAGGVRARVLVGAGGHFCPVARQIAGAGDAAVVAAQEVEYALDAEETRLCPIDARVPELYFTRDLTGYGWVFRKRDFLNVGLGVRAGSEGPALSARIGEFLSFLVRSGRLLREPAARMKGHAYVLRPDGGRRVFGNGYVLVGDAAALAYDRSGEGIRPAVESGIVAASVVAGALRRGRADASDLAPYAEALDRRFGARRRSMMDSQRLLPRGLQRSLAAALVGTRWFSRRVLLERWFLHMHEPALSAST
ncbi:MAG TPA: NAD(P)/FAD-dependent oxidoreductase [Candidatus Limnocylindrales bacterium]|nr:NAD(P)/FAD-dependent oxidoreductase [Candidatus Limnocylindrales bacterium]